MQRKNPRKLAWTVVYRRMHKKGITEEVAKKRSRRTVKYQRGIVGADLGAIAALRNQTLQSRNEARIAAISKAKQDKKAKEEKKKKVCCIIIRETFSCTELALFSTRRIACYRTAEPNHSTQDVETTDEGWQRRSLSRCL